MNTNIISKRTAARYEKIAQQLRARYTRETGVEPEADCAAFKAWLLERYTTLASASRRQYYASLRHYQGKHHPKCLPDPVPEGLPDRKTIKGKHGKRGPANKAKSFPPKVGDAVLNALRNAAEKSRGSVTLSVWAYHLFRASLRFGLRPVEWRGARLMYLEDGESALQVPNAKNSYARAFGPTRILIVDEDHLEKVDPLALESALWLTENARPLEDEDYQKILGGAEKQMRTVLRRCGTPCKLRNGNITLYTARHQFSANAKSDGLTKEEIAALMGHASIDTAGQHYGKRRSGHGGRGMHVDGEKVSARGQQTAVSPHIDNLRKVEVLEQERQERKERQKQRKKPKSGPGMG